MKKIYLLFICYGFTAGAFAQTDSFDVLNYKKPFGWKKTTEANFISYTNIVGQNWCRINLIKSTVSTSDVDLDFQNEWQQMVVKSYNPLEEPLLEEIIEDDGWKIKSGRAHFKYENTEALVLLTTATGYKRCVSIIAITNSEDFMKDIDALLASVNLNKPDLDPSQTAISNGDRTIVSNDVESIIGTWCMHSSDNSSYRVKNGVMSTIFRQYTFNENGTYTSIIKTYDPLMNSTLLGKENGIYKKQGNNFTLQPQRSVLEEWSKINNRDEWGKLLKKQNIALEKVTYSFTKLHIPENNEWQLILKANTQTRRDGPFNNYQKDAWVYINSSPARPLIKLPEE